MDELHTTAQEGDFQVSRRGKLVCKWNGEREKDGKTKRGHKGDREHVPYYVCMLIRDCVQVINKTCVQGARYMHLISWTLQCGSEH